GAGLFRRVLAILEVDSGRSIAETARLLRTSRVTIYHWIGRFQRTREPTSLVDHRGGNRPSVWDEELQNVLRASMGHRPEPFGYQAVEWTVPLLGEHLARWCGVRPSASSIRSQLHALGYVWKRPRYVVDPDPEREKKTRVAKLTGDTVAPTSRDRRPGHGGSAAASAAPRAAPPTSLAAFASPPHSPDATPSLPPAGAASPSPRSPAPSPSRPDPARPAADHWTDARGSDGCRKCAPGRCSSSAGPRRRSTETSPASSSGSPSGTASTPLSPRARPSSSPPGASAPAVAPAVAAPSSPATPPRS